MAKLRKFKCRNESIVEEVLEKGPGWANFWVISSTRPNYTGRVITLAKIQGKKFAMGGAQGTGWDITEEIK